MQKMTQFFFGAMRDEGVNVKLLGAFDKRGALTVARLTDGACEWKRKPGEHCSDFETRILADLRELMGLAIHATETRIQVSAASGGNQIDHNSASAEIGGNQSAIDSRRLSIDSEHSAQEAAE